MNKWPSPTRLGITIVFTKKYIVKFVCSRGPVFIFSADDYFFFSFGDSLSEAQLIAQPKN